MKSNVSLVLDVCSEGRGKEDRAIRHEKGSRARGVSRNRGKCDREKIGEDGAVDRDNWASEAI